MPSVATHVGIPADMELLKHISNAGLRHCAIAVCAAALSGVLLALAPGCTLMLPLTALSVPGTVAATAVLGVGASCSFLCFCFVSYACTPTKIVRNMLGLYTNLIAFGYCV